MPLQVPIEALPQVEQILLENIASLRMQYEAAMACYVEALTQVREALKRPLSERELEEIVSGPLFTNSDAH